MELQRLESANIIDITSECIKAKQEAEALVVQTQADADRAVMFRQKIQREIDDYVASIAPYKKRAHEVHKYFTGLEKMSDKLKEAQKMVDKKIVQFEAKKRQEAIERQRRADEDAALMAAISAEQDGLKDLSGAILDGDVIVTAPVVEVEKTEGITLAKRWTFEIVDASLLPREYMMPDPVKIGKDVRTLGALASIPGVKTWEEVSTRGILERMR